MVSERMDQLYGLFLKAQMMLLIKNKIEFEYFWHYEISQLDLVNHRISVWHKRYNTFVIEVYWTEMSLLKKTGLYR
jgi:hypothetical protein